MPWATLELDPAQANERDVKRAYAKRLKTCRPDQDPEGFRQLHDAYTAALAELQWRGGGARDYPDSELEEDASSTTRSSAANNELLHAGPIKEAAPAPVSSAAESSPALVAVADAFDRLEAAIAGGQSGVADLVRATEAVLYEHPAEAIRWGELMYDLIGKHGSHPDLRLKREAMVFELEHAGIGGTLAVIERLDREGSADGISNLANLLLQNKQRITNPGAGIAAARLAGAAAFWSKRHAAPLADFAYENLARGERDFHMQLIDRHGAMANFLQAVPDRFKSFWRRRIMHTAGSESWDDEESREAVRWLDTSLPRRGELFQALSGLLPEQVAATLSRAPSSPHRGETGTRVPASTARDNTPAWDRDDRPRKPQPVRPGSNSYRPRQPAESHGGNRLPVGAILWITFIVVKVLFLAAKCSGNY